MRRALGLPFGAISLVLILGLAGCPTPIPTCKSYKLVKPGIDLRTPSMALQPLPQGYASVFGHAAVNGAQRDGSISIRLISYKDRFSRTVYGEKEVPVPRDGRFHWILPVGHYAIQPLYFHYDYAGHRYRSVKALHVSLVFDAPESARTYFLGRLEVTVSPELEVTQWRISGDEAHDGTALQQIGGMSGETLVSLLRQGSESAFITVPRRKVCQKWNMPSWCVAVPYGGCFDVDDG